MAPQAFQAMGFQPSQAPVGSAPPGPHAGYSSHHNPSNYNHGNRRPTGEHRGSQSQQHEERRGAGQDSDRHPPHFSPDSGIVNDSSFSGSENLLTFRLVGPKTPLTMRYLGRTYSLEENFVSNKYDSPASFLLSCEPFTDVGVAAQAALPVSGLLRLSSGPENITPSG